MTAIRHVSSDSSTSDMHADFVVVDRAYAEGVFYDDEDIEDISSEAFERSDQIARILKAIFAFETIGLEWGGAAATLNAESADTARKFFRALPNDRELPQIAPDGEGGLLLVWEPPIGNCIVTVQNDRLHLVTNPGTPAVGYVDDEPFRGRIPVSILHLLPKR